MLRYFRNRGNGDGCVRAHEFGHLDRLVAFNVWSPLGGDRRESRNEAGGVRSVRELLEFVSEHAM